MHANNASDFDLHADTAAGASMHASVDHMTRSEQVAEQLQSLIERSGLDVKQLAERSGVDQATLWRWINQPAKTEPYRWKLKAVAEAAGETLASAFPESAEAPEELGPFNRAQMVNMVRRWVGDVEADLVSELELLDHSEKLVVLGSAQALAKLRREPITLAASRRRSSKATADELRVKAESKRDTYEKSMKAQELKHKMSKLPPRHAQSRKPEPPKK